MDRRRALALLVVVAGVATVATPAVAQGDFEERNERPLPEAGLDQDGIINGSRVYLDALGTSDPDGNVTKLKWTIRNVATNETVVPECPNCTTTHFTPPEPGRYAATITATDNDGATASDTMYVEVIPAAGPEVDVLAPNTTLRNASTPIQVRASATNASLTRMRITVDWRVIEARAVDTREFAINVSHRFNVR